MKKLYFLLFSLYLLASASDLSAQACNSGSCSNFTNQYPTNTFSTTSSSWSTVKSTMNAGNWTLFDVTQGNTYEWSYCSDFGGSQAWDTELTLYNNSTNQLLCYQDNSYRSNCPYSAYLGWTATFTGKVKLLTSAATTAHCKSNTGSPYSTLVWRQSAVGCTPVAISSQPSNQTVTSGTTATFSVGVTGTTPFLYFWYKNGTHITGSSSSSYTTPILSSSDNGNTYYCIVTNCNSMQQAISNTVTLTVNSSGSAPSTPTGFSVISNSSTTIDLRWDYVPNAGEFTVVDCNNSNNTWTGFSNNIQLTGLTPSTYYSYKVKLSNSYGSSSYTNCVGTTTQNNGSSIYSISGYVKNANNQPIQGITVVFNSTAYSGVTDVTGYYIINNIPASSSGNIVPFTSGYTYSPTSIPVSSLNSDLVNKDFTATTISSGEPLTPTGFVATNVTASSITLMWNTVSGATGYEVYTCAGTLITNTSNVNYIVTGLTPETYYEYKVRAVNANGNSEFTNCKGAATLKINIPISDVIVNTVILNNSCIPQTKELLDRKTNQTANIVKICADGSTATKLIFTNNSGINSSNIRFWIDSDPYGLDSNQTGYFINYKIVGNVISAEYAHPNYVADQYKPYRKDTINIVDITKFTPPLYKIPIQVYRAPIIMVHGLWGEVITFQKLEDNVLVGNNFYPKVLSHRVNYEASNAKSFTYNKDVVSKEITSRLKQARENNFSAARVDIVTHSMGGILARNYIQSSKFTNSWNVHKLILLNTPHSGSQAANLLMNTQIHCPNIVGTIMLKMGKKSINEGAIEDLVINSKAMFNLNVLELNNNTVPSHCIVSDCSYPPSGNQNLVKLYNTISGVCFKNSHTPEQYVSYLFYNKPNDLIVNTLSQTGGVSLNGISYFSNQQHLGSASNDSINSKILKLLNTSSNSIEFSQDGFNPIDLSNQTHYKQDPEQEANGFDIIEGSVTISYPVQNQEFDSQQTVPVTFSTSNGVKRVLLVGISKDSTYVIDTILTNGTLNYTLPINAFESVGVMLIGYDTAAGIIGFDTVTFKVGNTVDIDSINFYPDTLYFQKTQTEAINLTGYVGGYPQNISNFPGITFEVIDTTILKHEKGSLFKGLLEGFTYVFMRLSGKTKIIPVIIYPSDTSISITNSLPNAQIYGFMGLKVYPNPSNSDFRLQLVFGQNTPYVKSVKIDIFNQLGQKVYSDSDYDVPNEYLKDISLHHVSSGVYYIKVITDVGVAFERIVIEK